MIPICEEIEVLTNPVQLKKDEYLDESVWKNISENEKGAGAV